MTQLLLVGLGGFFGAIARYGISVFVTGHFQDAKLPYHTLTANIIGCFLIGLLWVVFEKVSFGAEELKLLFITGILGGFTTFSAFGNETLLLFKKGELVTGVVYVLLSVVCGLLAVWLGHRAGQMVM
ncbi:MAG: fluoride efflux transporter CrcB [Fibrobacteria bacterium]|nr:fluoride efflux transporter CrcB [Fibrobacteria bacterium]